MLLALSLAFAILVSIFALQNSVVVPVQFFSWSSQASLVVIILASALAGAVVVGSLSLVRQVGSSFRTWELRSQIANLEVEVKRLQDKVKTTEQAGQDKVAQDKALPDKRPARGL